MNSLTHSIATQFVMARSPMTYVVAGGPSRAARRDAKSALRGAINAVAEAAKLFPISALQARKQ